MLAFAVTRIELALYGFVFGFLALVVGVPLVLLLRYYRFGTGLRLLGRRTGVDRWTAVPAVVVTLAVVAAFGWYGAADGPFFEYGAAAFLLGGLLATTAVANYDWFRAVRDLPRRATGDHLDGPVQVTGEARPLEGTLTGPVSNDPCLAYEVSVRERRGIPAGSGSRAGLGRGTATVATDADAVPFVVDDGSGGVAVDPDAVTVRPTDGRSHAADASVSVDGGDLPPPHVQRTAGELGIGESSRAREYRENSVRPGETVHVVGSVDPLDGDVAGYRVVSDGPDAPCAVAAAGDRDSVRTAVRNRVRYAGALGVSLLAAGGLGMALALP